MPKRVSRYFQNRHVFLKRKTCFKKQTPLFAPVWLNVFGIIIVLLAVRMRSQSPAHLRCLVGCPLVRCAQRVVHLVVRSVQSERGRESAAAQPGRVRVSISDNREDRSAIGVLQRNAVENYVANV